MRTMYDVIIIGSGPGGLTAGLYAGRAGLKTLILDKKVCGGTVNTSPLIENYPGIDNITGMQLTKNMALQTKKYAEILEYTKVKKITGNVDNFKIECDNEVYESKYVVIATGTTEKTLDAEGIEEFSGRGVSYCAVCDGNFFTGQDVVVVGGGNSAAVEALYLNRIGVNCSMIHRRDKLRCDAKLQEDLKKNNVNIYWNSQVKRVNGTDRVESVTITDDNEEEKTIDVSGIFVAIGTEPNNKVAIESDIKCDAAGYIEVDENMQTQTEGIYAVGDVTGGVKQIIVASGQAAIAITDIQYKLM